MKDQDDKRLERLKQINTAAECSLEVGLAFVIVMIVIFFVLVQDEIQVVLFLILSIGILSFTISSYESLGFVRRASCLLLPWYLWIIKSFCYFISGGTIIDQTLIEYLLSFVLMIIPALVYEYSLPTPLRTGIGLRVIFLVVAMIDLIPFEDSNPFLSIEKGIARVVLLSVIFILYSVRSRYETTPATSQDEDMLILFIRIQYTLFAGFWLSITIGVMHALYLSGSILMNTGRKTSHKKKHVVEEEYDSTEEVKDEPVTKPPVTKNNQLDSFGSENKQSR